MVRLVCEWSLGEAVCCRQMVAGEYGVGFVLCNTDTEMDVRPLRRCWKLKRCVTFGSSLLSSQSPLSSHISAPSPPGPAA